MVFHWSFSDSKSPQVSWSPPSILADLNYAIVWMVSNRPLISKSSSPFVNPSVAVPIAPIKIGIIATFMFYSFCLFFRFPSKVKILILLFTFFQFYSVVSRDNKVHNSASSLSFLLIIIRSSRLADIRWSVCMSKSKRSLCVSFSRANAGLYKYHFFVLSIFNFLHNFQWIALPTQSFNLSVLICCIRLIRDWLFRLYHYTTYICCFVASYLFLLWYDWFLWSCFV